MPQITHWFEPLFGYPISTKGINRWFDGLTLVHNTIMASPELEKRNRAVEKASCSVH